MYKLYIIKRWIEDIFIYPFILTGKVIAYFIPMKKEYRVFFLFPFYHTGGAEKIHIQVVQATGGSDCIIFFTRKSADTRFMQEFKNTNCTIIDISHFTDNKWLHFLNLIYRGIVTSYINRQKLKPVVFNGQCNFAYKVSPWVKKNIKQVEVIHSLNSFSWIRIPFLPFISKTVMISKKRIDDHRLLYLHNKIPVEYLDRVEYIQNCIPLTKSETGLRKDDVFKVVYSGRPGPEKRIHLIIQMAEELHRRGENVQFEMIGDLSAIIESNKYPYIKFYGTIDNDAELNKIYAQAHLLLITSTTEGFPMVIMEAMDNGCAILSTAVGDIPYHIKNKVNGFLFSSSTEEKIIVSEGVDKILWFKNNPGKWKAISENNISYARENFGIEKFNAAYQRVLFN